MQDSKLLRRVDRHIGKASCRILSWVHWLFGIPSEKAVDSMRNVLLIELFEMGAGVMLLPSINYLKKHDPQIDIHVLTTKTCLPVWRAINALDQEKIRCMEAGSPFKFLWSAARTLFKLRFVRFDLIIDYELFMRISAIFSGLLRARRRAGFYKYDFEGLDRGEFYHARCAFNQNSHISRNYLSLTKTAFEHERAQPNFKGPISFDEVMIKPTLAKVGKEDLRGLVGGPSREVAPYIVVCPDVGKTLAMRNYPQESFAEVIEELLSRYPWHRVVMIGTAENRVTSQAILTRVPQRDRCLDLCGETNFEELLKVISGAEVVITNDNGPAHFATLTGTKVLALFSTDSPFVYGPSGDAVVAYSFYQCSPCISAYNHKTSRCDNNLCLQVLEPHKVVELAALILNGQAKFRTINNQIPYLF